MNQTQTFKLNACLTTMTLMILISAISAATLPGMIRSRGRESNGSSADPTTHPSDRRDILITTNSATTLPRKIRPGRGRGANSNTGGEEPNHGSGSDRRYILSSTNSAPTVPEKIRSRDRNPATTSPSDRKAKHPPPGHVSDRRYIKGDDSKLLLTGEKIL